MGPMIAGRMTIPFGRHFVVVLLLSTIVDCKSYVTGVEGDKAPSPGEKKDIYIAVIIPSLKTSPKPFPFVVEKVSPAIDIALETIIAKNLLPPSHKLNVSYADSMCDSAFAMNEAIKFFLQKKVDMFLGPVCDYAAAPVGRQSHFWNIPLITPGAMAQEFGDVIRKKSFRTMIRVGSNFNTLVDFLMATMAHHNWTRFRLVYESDGKTDDYEKLYHFTASGIHNILNQPKIKKIKITHSISKLIYVNNFADSMAHEIGRDNAVVVLCTSSETAREIMIKAHELNFDNGEYVFFHIDLFSSTAKWIRPWYRPDDTPERNEKAKLGYQSLMTVTLRKPNSSEYRNFSSKVTQRAQRQYGLTNNSEKEVNNFVGAFHDAVILYALALNETLAAGEDPANGTAITQRMWDRTFTGVTGTVSIDANGDRTADYSLLDMDPVTWDFRVVANFYGTRKKYEAVQGEEIYWVGMKTEPPPDTPTCGFDGSKCPPDEPFPTYAIVTIVLGALLVIVTVAALLVYRNYRLKSSLDNWRVKWDDIDNYRLERSETRSNLIRRHSIGSNASVDMAAIKVFATGSYRGAPVAIKFFSKQIAFPSKPMLRELKRLRDMHNNHIVRFFGICVDPRNHCIVTEFCQKGSLQDVLKNDQVKLENMIKFSLMQDIIRGMTYLHASDLKFHGRLKSSNCVVDSRFVLKITDFGLNGIRDQVKHADESTEYQSKLWTAPEILRVPGRPSQEIMQKADVYSFAIICQEIIYRKGVFYVGIVDVELTPKEIHRRLQDKIPFIRPTLSEPTDEGQISDELKAMIEKCWAEEPIDRPEFQALKKIKELGEADGKLVENLLSRMEKYAKNLESVVEKRTAEYKDLLHNMLPETVAAQLMRKQPVQAEKFDCVTIYFSDICDFTVLAAVSTPMEIVRLLNELYSTFDGITDAMDVYKVETIGDAYMVVSGLPIRNGNGHAREIARMSLRLLNAVKSFKIPHRPDDKLKLRIGIHSGPVCAGVVGLKMPRYCLFGDTVNTASRMESHGDEWKIHVSPHTKAILDSFETFNLQLRGNVHIKGKGWMVTYWLCGETNPKFPDLVPPKEGRCDTYSGNNNVANCFSCLLPQR